MNGNKFVYSLSGHKNWIRKAEFSPDTRLISSGSDDKMVNLYDTDSQKLLHTYNDNNDKAMCVKFHPDGTCLASGSFDGKIKVIRFKRNKIVY